MGVQGAYGILAEVVSHPFPTDAMLFMDWRDEHTASIPDMQESNRWDRKFSPVALPSACKHLTVFNRHCVCGGTWRVLHLSFSAWLTRTVWRHRKLPTFLYAMPFSTTRIFLEETSLVARPAVPFLVLKEVRKLPNIPHIALS